MYRPQAFAIDDHAEVLELLRAAAFGHFVTTDPDRDLQATALPFVVDDQLTTVRAHVARANPHWRHADGADALLIVAGVDAYVSPRWYPTKATDPRVVPTWNYELVHLRGTVRVVDDREAKRAIVEALTDHHESRTQSPEAGPEPWTVADAPDDFVDRMLRALVGLEIAVSDVEAKRKLSQNRPDADRRSVADALTASADHGAAATGQQMAGLDDRRG